MCPYAGCMLVLLELGPRATGVQDLGVYLMCDGSNPTITMQRFLSVCMRSFDHGRASMALLRVEQKGVKETGCETQTGGLCSFPTITLYVSCAKLMNRSSPKQQLHHVPWEPCAVASVRIKKSR